MPSPTLPRLSKCFCGSERLVMIQGYKFCWVECEDCGIRGAEYMRMPDAISAWDFKMRGLGVMEFGEKRKFKRVA